MRKTKILATLGPATEEKLEIKALIEAGMNMARLNFSHGSYDQFKKIVKNIHAAEKESGQKIEIMQDLQGPKIRLGDLPPEGIKVKKGQVLNFCTKGKQENCIPLPYPPLAEVVEEGDHLLIEDGLIRTKIVSKEKGFVKAKVLIGGVLKSHKGVNIPDSRLPASEALNQKDQKDLEFGVKTLKVDCVAVSFVEKAEDIERVRKALLELGAKQVKIIAKIERPRALKKIKEIIEASDWIMVARGDLGIEIEAERVPVEQKKIIALCRKAKKPVIIATQVLQSMIKSPLATRAEVSDAANAIFDGANAVMLSNETAVGSYPTEAVATLARIAEICEKALKEDHELFSS
jgi:pyruvate kinase